MNTKVLDMSRKKIAVVGGGQIGGILALQAAERELGDIVLVDIPEKENFIKGKALDIMQLRPHTGLDVDLSGSGDFSAIAGADVIDLIPYARLEEEGVA